MLCLSIFNRAKTFVAHVLGCISVVALVSSAAVDEEKWQSVAVLRQSEGNVLIPGIFDKLDFQLLLQERDGEQRKALLELKRGKIKATLSGPGGESALVCMQFDPLRGNRRGEQDEIVLKIRRDAWSLYINDRLYARVSPPFQPPATLYWPKTRVAEIAGRARYQPAAPEFFRADFMVEEGAPSPIYPWEIQTGEWGIHTVKQDAIEEAGDNLNRVTQAPPEPGRSPNFFSLQGSGENAIVTAGYDFYDDYEYSVAQYLNSGTAGLVFYHRGAADFYAFTYSITDDPQTNGILELWKMERGIKSVLQRVQVEMFQNQWYQPAVAVSENSITCFLDNLPIMRAEEPMPPGGKFGLFVSANTPARFDDVKVDGVHSLNLSTEGEIRFHTLFADDGFSIVGGGKAPGTIRAAKTKKERRIVFGRAFHEGAVFSAELSALSDPFSGGLVLGFQKPQSPYYLFEVQHKNGQQRLSLIRRTGDVREILSTWDRPLQTQSAVTLMGDLSRENEMRFYLNGELVLFDWCEGHIPGGAGVFTDVGSQADIRKLTFGFRRTDVYEEKQQPNDIFRTDPYMRHWAAPEGEWTDDGNGSMWHKGDFYAGFRMTLTCTENSAVYFGIPDGEQAGELRIVVRDGEATVICGRDQDHPALTEKFSLANCPAPAYVPITDVQPAPPPPPPEELAAPRYLITLNIEDNWLWIDGGGERLLKIRMPTPLAGTRVRATGLGVSHLAHTIVTRRNVMDDFFNESPYNWIINGGSWHIINRFQCQPRWSHMAGESDSGMAGIWHKYWYSGDLTLEFYAGIRHGWYETAGDLNCAVMAQTTAPDSGYAVTCTEWDYNLSQKWSALYRKGIPVGRTDSYMVPRLRSGMERLINDPLLADGRPMHGAWYYIKLRRVGSRVEYYFDNALVMSYDEKEPIDEGMVGIWTFLNSMTVARVRTSFQQVRPYTFDVRKLPTDREAAPSPPPQYGPQLYVNGFPLDSLRLNYWKTDDDTGQARLTGQQMDAGTLWLRNRLGSGNMRMNAELPSLVYSKIAGWQFQVKTTERTSLNLHYSLGGETDGNYVARQRYFHNINGSDFSRGTFTCIGSTPVAPGVLEPSNDNWSSVRVWIPSKYRGSPDADAATRLKLEGFGHFQPNYRIAGIGGAWPGDGYAVRQLTPIFYGVPAISCEKSAGVVFQLQTEKAKTGHRFGSADELSRWLEDHTVPGLNQVRISIEADGRRMSHDLVWVQLADKPDVDVQWDSQMADCVRISLKSDYPDPRFASLSVSAGGTLLTSHAENEEVRIVHLPRPWPGADGSNPVIRLALAMNGLQREVELARKDQKVNAPPVLVALNGVTPFLLNFEGATDRLHEYDPARMRILHEDPVQGRCFEIRNRDLNQRMKSAYLINFSLAQYPLMQFRYKADDMTYLSARFQASYTARLNADLGAAVTPRFAADLVQDGSWRTWLGFVTDSFTGDSFDLNRFVPPTVALGSVDSRDQTGRYSRWILDDFGFGPAIRSAEQLQCQPDYFDADGIKAVCFAVLPGERPYHERPAAEQGAVAWQELPPATPLLPDIAALSDGVHHLLLKAKDNTGAESMVTDLPFLLDRKPLEASSRFAPASEPHLNGARLAFDIKTHGGAPWQADKAVVRIGGVEQRLASWGNSFIHQQDSGQLFVNYAYEMRELFDQAADGDQFEVVLDGLVDGAGNTSPPHAVQIKVDYNADKHGPSWYDVTMPTVAWRWNGETQGMDKNAFTPVHGSTLNIITGRDGNSFFRNKAPNAVGQIVTSNLKWNVSGFPWLGLRLRMPQTKKENSDYVRVMLDSNLGRFVIMLGVGAPTTEKNVIHSDKTVDFSDGQWHSFVLNVGDFLKIDSIKRFQNMQVSKIHIMHHAAAGSRVLDVDDCYAFTLKPEPGKPDSLAWQAYDASGVSALALACVAADGRVVWTKEYEKRDIDLADIRAQAEGYSWLQLVAKDKAGNVGTPMLIPFPEPFIEIEKALTPAP